MCVRNESDLQTTDGIESLPVDSCIRECDNECCIIIRRTYAAIILYYNRHIFVRNLELSVGVGFRSCPVATASASVPLCPESLMAKTMKFNCDTVCEWTHAVSLIMRYRPCVYYNNIVHGYHLSVVTLIIHDHTPNECISQILNYIILLFL